MSGSKRADETEPGGADTRARELLRADPDDVALPDFDALEAELAREIAEDAGPRGTLRSLSTPLRYLLACSPLLALALLTLVIRPRLDLSVYPAARMALVLSLVASLVLASVVTALWSLSYRPLPTWLSKLLIVAAPVALFVLYILPAAHTAHPASIQAPGTAALLVRALPCLLIGSAVAASAYFLLRAFDRGATRASLLFAAGAGLYANLLLQLHCSVTDPGHMLLGHLGALLIALALGSLRARRD